MMTTAYQERVYALCKRIPTGKVSTYGALAKALKSSARAVGQAMRCNPYAPSVPCHRVVASDGKLGGFMGETAGKQISKKISLLKKEGVTVKDGIVLHFEEVLFTP